jgi:hypothetical protein
LGKRVENVWQHLSHTSHSSDPVVFTEETTPAQTPVETEGKALPTVETPTEEAPPTEEAQKEEEQLASWEEVEELKDDWATSDVEGQEEKGWCPG